MPDKCKKQKDCGCGCAKRKARKRTTKPKAKARTQMGGYYAEPRLIGPVGAPFMAPIYTPPPAPATKTVATQTGEVVKKAPVKRSVKKAAATIETQTEAPLPVGPTIQMVPSAPPVDKPKRVVKKVTVLPVGPTIRMMPQPSAPPPDQPKPAKYARTPTKSTAVIAPAVPLVQPMSRYGAKILAMQNKPAFAPEGVTNPKPVRERKTPLASNDIVRPSNMEGVAMGARVGVLPRNAVLTTQPQGMPVAQPVPSQRRATKQLAPVHISDALESPGDVLNKPQTIKQILKTPTVIRPKQQYIPTLPAIKENVLYGFKKGSDELVPIAGGGAGKGGRKPTPYETLERRVELDI